MCTRGCGGRGGSSRGYADITGYGGGEWVQKGRVRRRPSGAEEVEGDWSVERVGCRVGSLVVEGEEWGETEGRLTGVRMAIGI